MKVYKKQKRGDPMFCPKCGKPLVDNAKFCTGCGASVTAVPGAPVSAPPAAPVAAANSGKKTGVVLAIIAGVLVVILLLTWLVISWLTGFTMFNGLSDNLPTGRPFYDVGEEPLDTPATEEPNLDAVLSLDNIYYDCFQAHPDYVLPQSQQRYYSRSEIVHLTEEELDIAYYEIAARHGATFQDDDIQAYFNGKSWYSPGSNMQLSAVEITNQEMLKANRAFLDGSIFREGNPYFRYFQDSYVYEITDSQNRYLDSTDLKDLHEDLLQLARSEIYARHGYICKTKELREYFYCKDWYIPSTPADAFDTAVFNNKEQSNVELIRVYEQIKKGVEVSPKNPYIDYLNYYGEHVIYDSSTRKLTENDVYGMNKQQLILARNEIFCRNGYVCSDTDLFAYFARCSWYLPETAPGDLDRVELNSTETANVNFLKKYQELLGKIPDLWSLDSSLTRTVETSYFTVKVPKYFKDYCEISKGKDDGVYNVKFYETLSKGYDGDLGRVFTITVVPSTKDYTSYKNSTFYGSIHNGEGKAWNILIRYPAGVEWTNLTYDLYMKMQSEIDYIMNTLSPKSGYTFSYYPA